MIHPYCRKQDARILQLRAEQPGRQRLTYREIAAVLTQEFGIERDAHSVQVRMTQLACMPEEEMA